MTSPRQKPATDVDTPLRGQIPYNPEQTDPLFWTPLEGALKKTTVEIEAIAIDWLYEILSLTTQQIELHILDPNENVHRNHFGKLLQKEPRLQLPRSKFPEKKPAYLNEINQLIIRITGLDRRDILALAHKILRLVVSFARSECQIVYESIGTKPHLCRITDNRLPFECLRSKELQSRPTWD